MATLLSGIQEVAIQTTIPVKYMKNIFTVAMALTLGFLVINSFAQDDCRVLLEELAGTYKGKCKNGLASGKGKAIGEDMYEGTFKEGLPDGKGTYNWANGDTYTGEWTKGLREGQGTFTYRMEGKETILAGIWKEDVYVGPMPKKPIVLDKLGVDRYTFRKVPGNKNRVLISFYQNGLANLDLDNFRIYSTSVASAPLGNARGFDHINFPVKIKVSYDTWNKLRTSKIYVILEFEIFEPGDWQVDIHN